MVNKLVQEDGSIKGIFRDVEVFIYEHSQRGVIGRSQATGPAAELLLDCGLGYHVDYGRYRRRRVAGKQVDSREEFGYQGRPKWLGLW